MTLDPALSICMREWRAAAKHLRLIFHPTLIRWACSGEKNSDFDHNHQHVGVSIQLGALPSQSLTLSKVCFFLSRIQHNVISFNPCREEKMYVSHFGILTRG